MIQGLSHLTFIVHDLDKMARLIVEVLGGEEVYASGENTFSTSREKFFLAGGIWIAIMEGESLPSRTYNHVAFSVSDEQLEKAKIAAEKLGLDIRAPRPRYRWVSVTVHLIGVETVAFDVNAHLSRLATPSANIVVTRVCPHLSQTHAQAR